ncbi:MAG: glucosaminidase domain-containing protein [Acidithiobacillus sp.]|nr:glucosaminidase domain-containing protein [Acidithiobacillus sp.]
MTIAATVTVTNSPLRQNATQLQGSHNSYAKAAEAADKFAAMFVEQMLDQMMPNMFGSTAGSGTYQQMILSALSEQISEASGGMGLVPILDKALGIPASAQQKVAEMTTAIPVPESEAGEPLTPISLATSAKEFVQKLLPIAQKIGATLGIDPKLIIAQAALETGWGKSILGNNLFGIKSLQGQPSLLADTEEAVNGTLYQTVASFRSFSSIASCMEHYANLLRNRYPQVLGVGDDVQKFASGLVQGGYATDPNYANKIEEVYASLGAAGNVS